MRKDNTFHHELEGGWVLLGGWASLSGVTYSSHSPRKMRLTLRGWSVAGQQRKNAFHFFSPFVISLRRRRPPDNENRKEKIYVPMVFLPRVLVRQKGRLHLFPPSSPRRRRGETIPAQFHFKSGRV